MLKWAVNGSTSTAATATARANTAATVSTVNWLSDGNHNHKHMTSSTPLHGSVVSTAAIPSTQPFRAPHDQLEVGGDISDLSRITTTINTTAFAAIQLPNQTTPTIQREGTQTLRCYRSKNNNNKHIRYARTLPTFDVEYSPCSMPHFVTGPLLALRGIEIPDIYFEKPRYFISTPGMSTSTAATPSISVASPLSEMTTTENKISSSPPAMALIPERSITSDRQQLNMTCTRCSTEMSDATLEHMIDAILENSTCGQKDMISFRYSTMTAAASLCCRQKRCTMDRSVQSGIELSPTYTRAEDPASDLPDISAIPEYDDARNNNKGGYQQLASRAWHQPGGTVIATTTTQSNTAEAEEVDEEDEATMVSWFREREVCSPKLSCVRCGHNNNTTYMNKNNNNNDDISGGGGEGGNGGGNSYNSYQLKRQRAVRRKRGKSKSRQLNKLHTGKLLSFSCKSAKFKRDIATEEHDMDKNVNELADGQYASPDSGRDSSSGLEEDICVMLEATKRRLSFSIAHAPCDDTIFVCSP